MTLVYPLRVSVLHSHLRQADYPVAIGDYRDDTIVSAEAALDVALGGRLSRRLDLDVYAGTAGAVEILSVPERTRPARSSSVLARSASSRRKSWHGSSPMPRFDMPSGWPTRRAAPAGRPPR